MEPQRISSLNTLPPPITNFPFSDPDSPFFSSPSSLTFLTSFDLSRPAASANFFARQHPQHMLFQQQQPVMGSSLWDHHPLEFGSFSAGIPPPLISAMDHLDASCLSMQDRKAMPDLLQHLPELLMKLSENPAHAKEIFIPSSTESTPQTSSVSCDQKHSSPKTSASTKDHTQKQAKQGPKKSRKAQQKRVVCVPATGPGNDKASAEAVPSDSWAWRKYGQKPIKGSPYPRGYYRCSTCKGCLARKQVERNKNDPTMFIITYTSDHNHPWPTHRNSLAGSTRPKPLQKAPDAKLTTTELYEHADGCHEDVDDNAFSSIVDSPNMAAQQFSYAPPASHASPIDEAHNFSSWRSGSVEDEDFFTELQELPDSYLSFGKDVLDEKPDEETFNAVLVDPYNLWVNSGVAL